MSGYKLMLSITLDTKQLDLIVKDGDKFLVSREGEKALLKFLEIKKRLEEAEEKLKELIKKRMEEEKITKVEGENVKIIKRFFGNRYKVKDPELVKQTGFGKVKEYVLPDNEAIETYIEETGKLPDGIEINDKRQEQVVISSTKKNED
ncbi:MAG: hypothetical protein N2505_06165 [Endomicrobia bacterium]|nr:hypothetical protein [Endomicrobiia bacterium]